MKKIILFFVMLFTLANPAKAIMSPQMEFIQTLTDKVITDVLKTNESIDVKYEKFEKYFLPALDTDMISKFVLGKHWRQLNENEKSAFKKAFIDLCLKSWADRFNSYSGQTLDIVGERPAEGKNQYYIDSLIENNSKPIEVIWRIRQKNNSFQIVDIIIEGVSMALTYRNQYTDYLSTHTLEELISSLENQSNNFVFTAK